MIEIERNEEFVEFESRFHRWYVGGTGPIAPFKPREEKPEPMRSTIKDIQEHYRRYMKDPEAELSDELMAELLALGVPFE